MYQQVNFQEEGCFSLFFQTTRMPRNGGQALEAPVYKAFMKCSLFENVPIKWLKPGSSMLHIIVLGERALNSVPVGLYESVLHTCMRTEWSKGHE